MTTENAHVTQIYNLNILWLFSGKCSS